MFGVNSSIDAKFLGFPAPAFGCLNQGVIAGNGSGELDVFKEKDINCFRSDYRRPLQLVTGFNGSYETKVGDDTCQRYGEAREGENGDE